MTALRPTLVAACIGAQAATAEFRNEIRAVYGGFGLALGGLLLLAPNWPRHAPGVVLAAAIALLGMATGRAISFTVEPSRRWPWLFAAIELAAGLALGSVAVGTV